MKKSYLLMETHLEVDKLQKSKTRKLIILLLSVFLLTSIFPISDGIAQNSSAEWINIDTINNVVISYQLTDCQGVNKLYLKIVNNNDVAITVKWSLWGENVFKSILLNANETKTGGCNLYAPIELDEMIPLGKELADLVPNIIIN